MLCNWSYKWSWRARSNSIENESVFPLKSSRVTSKIHFTGKCLANSNSGSFCVAVFICLFWPLICKWNRQLLNLIPRAPLARKSKARAALQAVSSGKTSKPPQVHFGWYGKSGTRAMWGEEPAGLCHAASGRGASFSKSCQPLPCGFFCGWEGVIFTWADERRDLRGDGNEQKVRISYATFAIKSSTAWNYTAIQESGKASRTFRALVLLDAPQRFCWTMAQRYPKFSLKSFPEWQVLSLNVKNTDDSLVDYHSAPHCHWPFSLCPPFPICKVCSGDVMSLTQSL